MANYSVTNPPSPFAALLPLQYYMTSRYLFGGRKIALPCISLAATVQVFVVHIHPCLYILHITYYVSITKSLLSSFVIVRERDMRPVSPIGSLLLPYVVQCLSRLYLSL